MLPRGATLAARGLRGLQPISNQPVGLGFTHRAGGIDAGDIRFRPRVVGACRDLEGFLFRRWEFIILGCGRTATLARGATLVARWLHEPQPINNQPVGLGFPRRAERYRHGGSSFLEIWNVFWSGDCLLYTSPSPRD